MKLYQMKTNCMTDINKLSISQIDSNQPGEDRYCINILSNELKIKLYAVIDGHGGFLAADIACDQLLDIIIDKLINYNDDKDLKKLLDYSDDIINSIINESFQYIDNIILNTAINCANESTSKDIRELFRLKEPIYQLAGCCVVVTVIIGSRLFVAHCGDCRALIFSKSNDLSMTLDSPSTDSSTDMNTNQSSNVGGPDYYCTDHEFELNCLTLDHSCNVNSERELIKSLTTDSNPIRPSINGTKAFGKQAPDRVAGSLAITRALGDGYLKIKELSMPMYEPFLPYITSTPTITKYDIKDSNIHLILASDGLFNFLTSENIHEILKQNYLNNDIKFTLPINQIINENENFEIQTGDIKSNRNIYKLQSHHSIDIVTGNFKNTAYKSFNNNNIKDEILRLFLPDNTDCDTTSLPSHKRRKSNSYSHLSISDLLVKKCIELAFEKSNININTSNKNTLTQSLNVLRSKNIRYIIDDVTVMVVGL